MKDRYYMKDIMAKFQVGRDKVKYYEKQGLITGYRDKNGYRYYDYLGVKRIERIFWLRNLGFSMEEVREFLSGLPLEEEVRLNENRINEMERQIESLKAQVEYAKEMCAYHKSLPECYKQYRICDDFEVCFGCEKNLDDGWLMHRDMKILYLNEDFTVNREEAYENVSAKQTLNQRAICRNCESRLQVKGEAVVGVLKLREMDRFPALLQKIQEDLSESYVLDHVAYCLDGYYIEANPREEGVAIEFYVPVTKKEEKL